MCYFEILMIRCHRLLTSAPSHIWVGGRAHRTKHNAPRKFQTNRYPHTRILSYLHVYISYTMPVQIVMNFDRLYRHRKSTSKCLSARDKSRHSKDSSLTNPSCVPELVISASSWALSTGIQPIATCRTNSALSANRSDLVTTVLAKSARLN